MPYEKSPDDTLSFASINVFAKAALPITIPSPPELIRLGTGFDTNYIGVGGHPWRQSLFLHLESACGIVEIGANENSYRESFTTSSNDSNEHLSGSLGVTIGNDFLNGSVNASYDKSVVKSKQGTQSSRCASVQVGRILMAEKALHEAMVRFHAKPNHDFTQTFGDYFVYGYVLGAERGVNLHLASRTESERESKSVTVKVKLLFLEGSSTTSETHESLEKEYEITVMGYDTLENRFARLSSHDDRETTTMRDIFQTFSAGVNYIEHDVAMRLHGMHTADRQQLLLNDCDRIYHSRLVKYLVLMPYHTMGIVLPGRS